MINRTYKSGHPGDQFSGTKIEAMSPASPHPSKEVEAPRGTGLAINSFFRHASNSCQLTRHIFAL
jgi:hypothetical protein